MNDPIELKALEEYLKGGSALSQHYRGLASDDVPPELDRRVLQRAREAVAKDRAKGSRAWSRWSAPVALAASVVLVLTIVLETGVQREASLGTEPAQNQRAESPSGSEANLQHRAPAGVEVLRMPEAPQNVPVQETDAFARDPAPPAVAPPAAVAEVPRAKLEARKANEPPAIEEVVTRARTPRFSVSTSPSPIVTMTPEEAAAEAEAAGTEQVASVSAAPSPSAAAGAAAADSSASRSSRPDLRASSNDQLSEVVVTGNRVRRPARHSAGPRDTIVRRNSADAADEIASDADPEEWLEEIRELRRDGKHRQANREWRRFSKAFPDYPVADDDLARKQR